ncbi:MAG: hypothetical protein AAF667_08490 [Pseudomonadota bacterium]
MTLGRREFLLGTTAIAAAGGVAFAHREAVWSYTRDIIARGFGDNLAVHPEAQLFVDEVLASISLGTKVKLQTETRLWPVSLQGNTELTELYEYFVIEQFARSTNAIRAHETGTDLVYFGLYDSPYANACGNTLSALWL